ncbi:hypothetical protein FA15DRAFT_669704 [Coprinopsis marcescibilis]|uniref:UBA domain-containing protein n=1 Tax=Coprinopsis marcescibilis TaxID=230819 RepID=A0A5C3KVK9_COPMA|nr:hypothetical protein FA15DRAFT_669704 [Coprinopsis marcescibilis]
MSDSFADLWSSTAPTKSQNLPLSQQQRAPSVGQNSKPKQDVFSLLSQSSAPNYGGLGANRSSSTLGNSQPVSRPITPSLSGSGPRPGSSLSQTSTATRSSANHSVDAFGDLFSGGLGSSKTNTANLTMAERAAQAQKQSQASVSPASRGTAAGGATSHQWAGLDSLGAGSFGNGSASSKQHVAVEDDWGLGDFGSKPATQTSSEISQRPSKSSLLDFGDFDPSPAPAPLAKPSTQSRSTSSGGSLWGIEEFSNPSSVTSADEDFDFGNREDRDFSPLDNAASGSLLGGSSGNNDDDDILGVLSKPIDVVRKQQQSKPTNGNHRPTESSQPTQRRTTTRSSSPPPHILGQIIEMGFSVSEAKAALARTESGVDVEAALEMLLGEGSTSRSTPDLSQQSRPQDERAYSDDGPRTRRRPAQPEREDSTTPNNIQDQADKLLAQASEIGLSVLSKASLFWKEGKEKVQKVYVEASNSGTTTPATGARDTRPKWMQEAASSSQDEGRNERYSEYDETKRAGRGEGGAGSFRDDDDDQETSAFASEPPRRPTQQPVRQPEPEQDLFSSAPASEPEPKVYVSRWRHKKPATDFAPAAPAAPAVVAAVAPSRPSRAPAPAPAAPKPKRHLPFCPVHSLARVQQHKTAGTDAFKLGQFSVAADEYSKAIALLPENHLLLVPLHTNRAIARIRCGECKEAVGDAGVALGVLGRGNKSVWESWHPSDEGGGWELENDTAGERLGGYAAHRTKGSEWSDTWGRGVDLKDGWVKAVKRRAEALEGLEKWKDAKKDWEVLAGGGSSGWVDSKTREEAVRGLGRCKKMIGGGEPSGSGSTNGSGALPSRRPAAPKPKPRPAPAVSTAPGVALKAYRAQQSALEAEDALKHSLKDTVDTKLLNWKKGKETNLRALLASLDTVLWEEVIKDMGGKPGMADLISGGGVKKWYMKSVARVHPDKLNTSNSSVEQRMIAGGVFGALNEAWLAFKQ